MIDIRRTTAALASAGLLLAAGCGDDDSGDQAAATQESTTTATTTDPSVKQPTADRTLGALIDAPRQFLDEQITVRGEVDGATSAPAAFELIRPAGGDDGITVLATEAATGARDVTTDETVTVEGTVVEVTEDLADQAEFLFETDQNASATVDRLEDRYVLVADSVSVQ